MSTGGTSYGYRFQRFQGEEEEHLDFDSARGLTTEAAEVLCDQMKAGIVVKVDETVPARIPSLPMDHR